MSPVGRLFLGEEGHECLVDLCIRDERTFCHQGVLGELQQGVAVAKADLHRVSQKERAFSFCLSIAAVRLVTRRRLFRHTWWALASFSEVVASDSPVSHSSVTSPDFPQGFHFADTWRSQRPAADAMSGFRLERNRFRGARKHRTFVSIVQQLICTEKGQTTKKSCLRNHATRVGTKHVGWKASRNNYSHMQSIRRENLI